MQCDYGCLQPASYQFKNKKWCCSTNTGRCPAVISQRVAARKNYSHSDETRRKIGHASKGRIVTAEWKENLSIASKARGPRPPMSEQGRKNISESKKGTVPWNKGLTSDTDHRVAKYAATQTGQTRIGNWHTPDSWAGENNPWYGKDRSKYNSPRYNGEVFNRAYKDYRNIVTYLTEQQYEAGKHDINPSNLPRVLNGQVGSQLDHIYPVIAGFKNNVPPELIADITNLQMLTWQENIKKNSKLTEGIPDMIAEFLRKYYV